MPENHKTKLVLFDLDGTLVDTAPDFLISLNNILKKYNRPQASIEGIKNHISEGTSKLIKFFFEIDETDLNFKKYRSEFLAEYEKNLTNESRLFSGMPELIEFLDLNSIRYGVVTNKFYKYAKPVLDSFSELKNIKTIVCPDHVQISKPDPEGILLACKYLSIAPEETIYLGDHPNDLKAGLAAGTRILGCSYGYSLEEIFLKENDYPFVNEVSEVISNLNL